MTLSRSTVLGFAGLLALAAGLYLAKTEAERVRERVGDLQEQLVEERKALRIAEAEATETCWPTIASISAPNPSVRLRSGRHPTACCTRAKAGSRAINPANPSARSASHSIRFIAASLSSAPVTRPAPPLVLTQSNPL